VHINFVNPIEQLLDFSFLDSNSGVMSVDVFGVTNLPALIRISMVQVWYPLACFEISIFERKTRGSCRASCRDLKLGGCLIFFANDFHFTKLFENFTLLAIDTASKVKMSNTFAFIFERVLGH
jgi:hypothetical protein